MLFFPKEILLQNLQAITYTIHVTGIYMYHKKTSIHVGKYTIDPIDPSWVMITTNLYGAVFFSEPRFNSDLGLLQGASRRGHAKIWGTCLSSKGDQVFFLKISLTTIRLVQGVPFGSSYKWGYNPYKQGEITPVTDLYRPQNSTYNW